MAKKKSNIQWYFKLRSKYRLVIFNDETFEERLIFRLTRLNVISVFISLAIIFTALTFLLVIYTPVKEYIPGYPSSYQRNEIIRLNLLADSLSTELHRRDLFFENIKNIVEGRDVEQDTLNYPEVNDDVDYKKITLESSPEDSLLREEFEAQNLNNLYIEEQNKQLNYNAQGLNNINFYPPISGVITSRFDLSNNHYGIDIAAKHNSAVMAVLEGTVVYADWTLETGNVIAIQHKQNLISVYKHNSALLKKEGETVTAGDVIAISGSSGEYSTGNHLHFELWHKGAPLDPENYILFH